MDRESKLAKLKKSHSLDNTHFVSTGRQLLDIVEAMTDAFENNIKNGININDVDLLIDKFEKIDELKSSVEELKAAVKSMPEVPEEIKIASLNEFIEAIKNINVTPLIELPKQKEFPKIPDYSASINKMGDAIRQMSESIKAAKEAASQKSVDWVPYRRVVKNGNTFVFDDQPTPRNGNGLGIPTGQTDSGYVYVPVSNPDGTPIIAATTATTATITRVVTSNVNTNLLASNANRVQAIIVNDATVNLYVKFGGTASDTDYTYLLQPYDTAIIDSYTGQLDAILASGTGNAQVTEL